MNELKEVWYRLEVVQYGYMDEWDNLISGNLVPTWREYTVMKTTPKGVWLGILPWGEQHRENWRFVLREAKKRFACPTKVEAKESFLFRKNRQIKILSSRLKEAEIHLEVGIRVEC